MKNKLLRLETNVLTHDIFASQNSYTLTYVLYTAIL